MRKKDYNGGFECDLWNSKDNKISIDIHSLITKDMYLVAITTTPGTNKLFSRIIGALYLEEVLKDQKQRKTVGIYKLSTHEKEQDKAFNGDKLSDQQERE